MATKIKSIKFEAKRTIIGVESTEQPRDVNCVVSDIDLKKRDMPRHADFDRAADRMKAHILIAYGLQLPVDHNGQPLTQAFFQDFLADSEEEKDRFGGLTLTGVIITGKHVSEGIQLLGTKEAPDGTILKLKTPVISLTKREGVYNYPLMHILDAQMDTFLKEADDYYKKLKHGAGIQTSLSLPPNVPDTNTKSAKNKVEETLSE